MKTGDIFSGRYRLLEKIGVGGYAQVWKAVDMMADDAVLAIKIFAADNGLDADGLKQFRREYALVLNLNHANLLTARHFDVWEGRPYLIMPYIEHGSLASRLLREGPMNEAELIDLIRQLSEALAYLHENDILHQDIKPDNVLIGPKGRYLLMDFGISSRLKSTLRKSTGSVGTMTVAYGPPERFDAQPKQLPAGDVFSLGVLAYEMATGDVPWMGNGGMSLKIGAEIPDLPEEYSESFKRLFRRMLSLGPDSRPSSSEINKAIRQKSTGTESGSTKKNLRVTERITPESSSYRETHNEIQSDPIESRRKTNSASGLKLVIGLFVGFIAIVILINLGGNEPIMPTVSTFAPYSITQNSAVSGGYITIENGAIAITERGVVWSTNQNPTITSNSGKTMNGRGTGSFASNMTGLNAGTTYYVRAYATNSAGTSYGEQRSFTTTAAVTLPALSTNTLSSITQNSGVSGGNVTADGGAAVTSRGVVWSTSQNPTLDELIGRTENGQGIGSFSSNLTNLAPGTTYYVWAYATNSAGTAYGQQRSFTTTAAVTLPALSTNTLSSITQNSGVSGGNVTGDGGAAVTSRGVVWSTSQNPTIASNSGRTTNGSGTGSYTSSLSGLSPRTTYYIRAYATNSAGTQYGEQRSFSTQSVVPISSGRDSQTAVVEVRNPRTGRVWMDRNLGASRAATSSNDTQAYGDLYQWGRAADGHQKRTSATTTTLSSTDQPGHGSFILAPTSPWDWRRRSNDNLWQGVNGINNPCPVGYRLPTEAEWEAERASWSSRNAAGAFNSPLKLPLAGLRSYSSGSLFNVGSFGLYWSGSVSGADARYLDLSSSYAGMFGYNRAYGLSVRCLRD
jgi:uncharacterized protein (TIGR02145 family)